MARRDRADRRNIIIAILIPLLFIAIAVIVIGIFLSSRQNINPVFRITYEARSVNAEVSATYRVEGDTSAHFLKSAEGEDFVSFDKDDDESTVKSLIMTDDVELVENRSHFVLFTYTFINRHQERKLVITMNDEAHKENVSVLYATSNDVDSEIYEETLNAMRELNKTTSSLTVECAKASGEGVYTRVTVYVLVSIVNPEIDALYETSDDTPFTFLLESTR